MAGKLPAFVLANPVESWSIPVNSMLQGLVVSKIFDLFTLGPDLHDRDHHHHRQYQDHHQPHVNGDQQTNFGSEVLFCNTGSAERDLLSLSSRYSVVSTAPLKYSHCNFNGNYKTFSFYLNTIYKYSHSMRPSLYLNVICGLPTFSHQNL